MISDNPMHCQPVKQLYMLTGQHIPVSFLHISKYMTASGKTNKKRPAEKETERFVNL